MIMNKNDDEMIAEMAKILVEMTTMVAIDMMIMTIEMVILIFRTTCVSPLILEKMSE